MILARYLMLLSACQWINFYCVLLCVCVCAHRRKYRIKINDGHMWCGYSGPWVDSLSFFSSLLSFGYSLIHPQSIQTNLTPYISLCPGSIYCKVKEMNVSPGKIHSSSVYSLWAFTAITSLGQMCVVFFFPQHFLNLVDLSCEHIGGKFFFSLLLLFLNV